MRQVHANRGRMASAEKPRKAPTPPPDDLASVWASGGNGAAFCAPVSIAAVRRG